MAEVVWLSCTVAITATLTILLPGVALGWWLARTRCSWRFLVDAAVLLPLVLPPVVTGYALLLLVAPRSPLGIWLEAVGLRIAFSWLGAVLAAAVMALPLLVRSVRVAVELADERLEEAAHCLGGSPWFVFRTVTLPLAWPGIIAGLVLAFARALGEFGATMTLAGNLPGETRTITLAIHSLLQVSDGESQALWLALIAAGLSLLALVAAELLQARHRQRLGVARAGM